jgi:rhodanese-related sulfurtransferase
VAGTERLAPVDASAALAAPRPPFVLDVRSQREWQRKQIDGSVNVPLSRLRDRIGELPRDRAILVHCAGGYRSSIAASLLEREGFSQLLELSGGLAAWEAARLPLRISESA